MFTRGYTILKPICWYWDSQLKTVQTSQIDFEEYDESGAARQRWRDAVDAVDGTAGGEGMRVYIHI